MTEVYTLGMTLLIFGMGLATGVYVGWSLWMDPVTRHCRHRYVEGVYGDERNHTDPFVLRCTSCGFLVEGGLEEANWPPR